MIPLLLRAFLKMNSKQRMIISVVAIVLLSIMHMMEAHTVQPDALSVTQPGDIMLGGLFPIHEKGEKTPCGFKVYYRGLQRLEAMMFAIDTINKNDNILPGLTLGVNILDTCSRDTYALNQSLQFIKSSLNNLDSSIFECPNTMVVPRIKKGYNNTGPVMGVIGGSYSSVSLQVANLLRLFHIPQISPASTAKALSDKTRFDYFARTVPPDTFQSIALVDIVKTFNWSYVSTVHSEGSYGEYGIEAFHREAQDRGVCIATSEKVTSDADDRIFDQIIAKLKKKENAKGVILFTRAEDARGILQAVRRAGVYEEFHFVASDGWGKQQKLVEGLEDVAEGAITVELQSSHVPGFDTYMKSLTPDNNLRNPWFQEYWQDTFGCLLEKNYPLTTESVLEVCKPEYRLSEQVGYEQESKVQFVVDAVYAFALALHNLHKDVCKNFRGKGVCPQMMSYDGGDFYKRYLLNVSFIDLAGSEVKFDSQGDGLARYDILNYQRVGNTSTFQYKVVGKWFNELQINLDDVVWNQDIKIPPSSACSLPCEPGMIKKQQGDTCCWICDKCEEYEYVYDEFTCMDCGPGNWPYVHKLSCYPLKVHVMQWDTVFVIIPVTVSLVGIVLTCAVLFIYIKHNDTPLIRASGRELSYLLLGGILLCYTNTFLLIAIPTMFTCVAQRFLVGTGFSTIYGSLFTKTNRISRIFNSAGHTAKRPSYISPKSQVLITLGLVGVQILLSLIWMIIEPAGTRYYYPDRKTVILKCKMSDMSFLFSQLYNIVLVFVCTVYAFKTRKIPENFNESKFIGFTMYTTCVVWLSFIPIYFSTGHSYEMQITTQCIVVSLSATVALACLYGPKCYIIIFHPDKNVRKLTMNSAAYKKHTLPGASSTGGTNIVPDSESPAHGQECPRNVITQRNFKYRGQHYTSYIVKRVAHFHKKTTFVLRCRKEERKKPMPFNIPTKYTSVARPLIIPVYPLYHNPTFRPKKDFTPRKIERSQSENNSNQISKEEEDDHNKELRKTKSCCEFFINLTNPKYPIKKPCDKNCHDNCPPECYPTKFKTAIQNTSIQVYTAHSIQLNKQNNEIPETHTGTDPIDSVDLPSNEELELLEAQDDTINSDFEPLPIDTDSDQSFPSVSGFSDLDEATNEPQQDVETSLDNSINADESEPSISEYDSYESHADRDEMIPLAESVSVDTDSEDRFELSHASNKPDQI